MHWGCKNCDDISCASVNTQSSGWMPYKGKVCKNYNVPPNNVPSLIVKSKEAILLCYKVCLVTIKQ